MRKLVLLGILFVSLFLSLYFFFPKLTVPPPEQEPQPEPQLHVIEGSVKERGTLYESLVHKKIPIRWIDLIVSELKPYVDFNRIKGGTYRFITDVGGELVRFLFEKSPTEVYEIEKGPQGYVVQKKEVLLERYLVKVVGEIRSSLFEAMNAIGEEDQLTISFAEILAWEIDFYKDVREGDRFKVFVEKIYKGDQFIQYGTIHAVEYARGERIIRGLRYQDDYYDEKGNSLKKAFLKVPLQFTRISSQFSRGRKHPILGGVQPHYGIDYAAPIGTPVWAVADGTVVSVGWRGGFGKQVVVRHRNGYKSYYGHLSRYGPGIREGMRVTQKQIIGYVGSTGLSTGPHLDYRLTKDGRFKNPLKEVFPTGQPIEKEEWGAFQKKKDEMIATLVDNSPSRKRLEDIISEVLNKRD
ncbi:MAG: M23 family metallopeptidase [Deltaproteobacteria bacterium]|nr:M23 family metallopeptidase [Deltaproteobacteria bacterium]